MQHTFKRHQLLNITTGRLWTQMSDIYSFFEAISGEDGIMTHMLPNALKAFKNTDLYTREPFISLPTEGFNPEHVENDEISFEVTDEDRKQFWKKFEEIPSLLLGKDVMLIQL